MIRSVLPHHRSTEKCPGYSLRGAQPERAKRLGELFQRCYRQRHRYQHDFLDVRRQHGHLRAMHEQYSGLHRRSGRINGTTLRYSGVHGRGVPGSNCSAYQRALRVHGPDERWRDPHVDGRSSRYLYPLSPLSPTTIINHIY